MKIRSFEFNLRELAGSIGDFGTLLPLAIGYIVTCGMDPSGFLVMMGLANIVTGIIYKLPMPIQPMKVLAAVAIAQHWSPSMVYASAFAMGFIWLVFALTGFMDFIAKVTPKSVTAGIQISLGLLLAFQAFKMILEGWITGIISILLIIVLRKNKYAPAAIVLFALGFVTVIFNGSLSHIANPGFTLPVFTRFSIKEIWDSLVQGGFAQIPLTATNAVIATAVLIKKYWPDKSVSESKLSLNMGIMNLIVPFFGGMPMCHGAGGLAAQYYYGARTGGTNIIEGLIEIVLGIFFTASIATMFTAFPASIIGAMLLLVGLELTKFAKDTHFDLELVPLAATTAVSLLSNMGYGFVAGLAVHYGMKFMMDRINKNSKPKQ